MVTIPHAAGLPKLKRVFCLLVMRSQPTLGSARCHTCSQPTLGSALGGKSDSSNANEFRRQSGYSASRAVNARASGLMYKLDVSPIDRARPHSTLRPPSEGFDIHLRPPAIDHRKAPTRPSSVSHVAPAPADNAPSCSPSRQYLVWPRTECGGSTPLQRGRVTQENAAQSASTAAPKPSLFFEGQPSEVAIPKEMVALVRKIHSALSTHLVHPPLSSLPFSSLRRSRPTRN